MSLPRPRGDREYFRFFHDNVAYTDHDGNAIPIGQFVGGQYNLVAPTYTDGDPGVFQLTSEGRLKVDTDITVTSLDVEIGSVEIKNATDDTRAVVKSDGTDNALVVTMNSLPAQAPVLAEGDNVAGRFKIVDESGANIANVVSGLLQVDVANIVSGTDALNLGKAEDAVHASGDTGVMALAVRNDTLAALGASDGDYAPLQVNPEGAQYVQKVSQTGANPSTFNDNSFVTGDSPVTLDINAALGRNARSVSVAVTGAGAVDVGFSYNNSDWATDIRLTGGSSIELTDVDIDAVKMTWVADSAYAVVAY